MDAILPQQLDLVRAALLPDGRLVDVAIEGDTVTRVAAVGTLHADRSARSTSRAACS